MVRRDGFTFIELIFAIVIIAITVLSLPVMNQITAKGVENSIIQEAIFGAAAKLSKTETFHWDSNSIDPSDPDAYAKVINVDNKCDYNASSTRYGLMPGHIEEPLHRRCLDSNTTTLAGTIPNLTIGTSSLFNNTNGTADDYKEQYSANTYVQTNDVNSSFGGTPNKNIKKITVSVKNANGELITSLHTYIMNIGETDYYKKAY